MILIKNIGGTKMDKELMKGRDTFTMAVIKYLHQLFL